MCLVGATPCGCPSLPPPVVALPPPPAEGNHDVKLNHDPVSFDIAPPN